MDNRIQAAILGEDYQGLAKELISVQDSTHFKNFLLFAANHFATPEIFELILTAIPKHLKSEVGVHASEIHAALARKIATKQEIEKMMTDHFPFNPYGALMASPSTKPRTDYAMLSDVAPPYPAPLTVPEGQYADTMSPEYLHTPSVSQYTAMPSPTGYANYGFAVGALRRWNPR